LMPGILYMMWREAVARNLLAKADHGPNVGDWALKRYPMVIGSIFAAIPIAFFNSEFAIIWILCWHAFFEIRPFFKHDVH